MTVLDIATHMSVTTAYARLRAKELGIPTQGDLSDDDARSLIARIKEALSSSTRPRRKRGDCLLADNPGLPLEALSDPQMREAFTHMRIERERRLMDLLRLRG